MLIYSVSGKRFSKSVWLVFHGEFPNSFIFIFKVNWTSYSKRAERSIEEKSFLTMRFAFQSAWKDYLNIPKFAGKIAKIVFYWKLKHFLPLSLCCSLPMSVVHVHALANSEKAGHHSLENWSQSGGKPLNFLSIQRLTLPPWKPYVLARAYFRHITVSFKAGEGLRSVLLLGMGCGSRSSHTPRSVWEAIK